MEVFQILTMVLPMDENIQTLIHIRKESYSSKKSAGPEILQLTSMQLMLGNICDIQKVSWMQIMMSHSLGIAPVYIHETLHMY